jgi:hypothetical protein
MKLFYIVLGLIFIGLIGGSFYYTNIHKDTPAEKTAANTPPTESIYIYREYGTVFFKEKAASAYTQVASQKMLIPNHSSVKTTDGRGYVIFPDNSVITLSTSTEIEINYTSTKVSILQLLGSTYHRVTSLAKGNTYEVRTPNTLAAIRGTKFAIVYNPTSKKTLVAVTEHAVEVTQTKEGGATLRAPVMVQEGSLAEVKSSTSTQTTSTTTPKDQGSMIMRTTSEVPEMKQFIDENKIIDKEYDKTPLEERTKTFEIIIQSLQKAAAEPSSPTKEETRIETVTKALTAAKAIDQSPKSQETSTTIKETIPTNTPNKTPITTEGTSPTARVASTTIAPITQTQTSLRVLPVSAEELTSADEVFVDTFYTAYEQYFLIDTSSTYCAKIKGMTSRDIISALLAITNKAGILLPKQTELTTFASDLVTSCADGTIGNKASTFKTRFDTTYPY